MPAAGAEEEKQSNEIKFAIPTLQQLGIAGRTITADAMHTQRKAAQYIVCEGGHYHFTVKANQPNLLEAIEYEFESSNREPDHVSDLEKDHGRIEQRRIWVSDRLNDYVSFPHTAQVFKVERRVSFLNSSKPDTCEVAYGITSLDPHQASAERCSKSIATTGR